MRMTLFSGARVQCITPFGTTKALEDEIDAVGAPLRHAALPGQDHARYPRRRGAARAGDATGYYPRYAAFPAGGNPICLLLIYCDQSALTNSADLRRCGARRGRC